MANIIISETTETIKKYADDIKALNEDWKKVYDNMKNDCEDIFPNAWNGTAAQRYIAIMNSNDVYYQQEYQYLNEYSQFMVDTAVDLENTIEESIGK